MLTLRYVEEKVKEEGKIRRSQMMNQDREAKGAEGLTGGLGIESVAGFIRAGTWDDTSEVTVRFVLRAWVYAVRRLVVLLRAAHCVHCPHCNSRHAKRH